jgi:hypothetical protein
VPAQLAHQFAAIPVSEMQGAELLQQLAKKAREATCARSNCCCVDCRPLRPVTRAIRLASSTSWPDAAAGMGNMTRTTLDVRPGSDTIVGMAFARRWGVSALAVLLLSPLACGISCKMGINPAHDWMMRHDCPFAMLPSAPRPAYSLARPATK